MIRATTTRELTDAIDAARAEGKRIAFVPTMGALHMGHLSLISEAKKHADFVVASIFVNPLQFAIGEDFDKYPRTLEDDLQKFEVAEVDVAWTPTVNDVYAGNMDVTQHAGHIGQLYEGAARPEHFDGMLTVVGRFFDLVKPDVAIFGQKDAQQVYLVREMAKSSYPNLEIITAPTFREPSGLAMSSRNRYLSEHELEVAKQLSLALRVGQTWDDSQASVLESARTVMAQMPEAKLDYIALVDADTFEAVSDGFSGRAILLIAAVVGETRLIDNIEITF